jgi:hypothetical protein
MGAGVCLWCPCCMLCIKHGDVVTALCLDLSQAAIQVCQKGRRCSSSCIFSHHHRRMVINTLTCCNRGVCEAPLSTGGVSIHDARLHPTGPQKAETEQGSQAFQPDMTPHHVASTASMNSNQGLNHHFQTTDITVATVYCSAMGLVNRAR